MQIYVPLSLETNPRGSLREVKLFRYYHTCNMFHNFSVCNRPSPPTNGSVWLSADGMTAVYSCELGFTLDGQGNSTCGQGGSGWSTTSPTCGMSNFNIADTCIRKNPSIQLFQNNVYQEFVYKIDNSIHEDQYNLALEPLLRKAKSRVLGRICFFFLFFPNAFWTSFALNYAYVIGLGQSLIS